MREMHKWKDKVELSLDNRQIFFVFFGLSVVGCFVFALGVMVGRRVDWSTTGEVAVSGATDQGALAMLDADLAREELSFKDGLAVPATEGLPPTRDPDTVGMSPDALEALAAEQTKADEAAASKAAADKGPKSSDDGAALASAGKGNKKKGSNKGSKRDAGKTKASSSKSKAKAAPKKLSGKFTLQMKAFSRADQAEAFANTLRGNGHQVRVEAHEVKGRIWHRVRVGAFKTWTEGLAAKESFESNESVIAYVVRL